MSSFFTTPASQKKRKRPQSSGDRSKGGSNKIRRRDDDISVSGSDVSEQDDVFVVSGEEDGSEDEDGREDAAERRIRLAEQYLANTRQEAMDEAGFDAADIDKENLRRRTGERLKEDTAEGRGKMYRMFAEELDWQSARHTQFRTDTKSVTGVAIAAGYIYTVSKDMALAKWRLPPSEKTQGRARSSKTVKVGFTKGKKNASDHHRQAILCVAASADGKFVATGGADSRLIVWNAETLKPLKVFTGQHRDNGHRDSVISLAFRRGTNQLFSASKDRTVKIWSCNELAYVETLFGHQDEVLDVDALGKEVCISVGGRDRTARYWRVVEETQLVFRGGGTGSSKRKTDDMDSGVDIPLTDEGHEGSIERIAFIDDDTFVTGSDNGMLSLWNIHKKKAIFTIPLAHGTSPPPGIEERSVEIDPAFQYQDTEMLLHLQPQPRWITALTVLPFSDVIVSGSWDGSLRAFQISADRRRIESLGVIGAADLAVGVVNDIAIAEKGDRGREGLYVAAALGREHRLGRWSTLEGKNGGILFDIPRKAKTALTATEDDE